MARSDDSEKGGPTSSERAANTKVPITKVDFCGFVSGCIGFLLLMFALNLENCPVRVGNNDPILAYPDRRYFYFAVSNNLDKLVKWSYLESLACEKYERAEEKYGGPLATMGTTMFSQIPIIGQSLGCDARQNCRMSLSNRCYFYKIPPKWKTTQSVMNIISAVFVCLGGAILLMCRKKKYRIYVAVLYTIAGFLPLFANYIIEGEWDIFFASMQTLAPYPFGVSQAGFEFCFGICQYFGFICLGIAYCAGCYGVMPEPSDHEGSGSDSDHDHHSHRSSHRS